MREKGSFWIAKPPNMWCGVGIKVIKDFSEVPAANPLLCVQKYIKQPLLINNHKFDIRVYLLVTSVQPLRICIYEEAWQGLQQRNTQLILHKLATTSSI